MVGRSKPSADMPSPNAIPRTPRQKALAQLGFLLAVGAVVCLLLVAIGNWCSDRFHWSQYLAWIPTLPACVVATLCLSFSWLLTRPRWRGRWIRRAGWILVAASVLYSTLVEWAGGTAPPGAPREQRLRLVYWNFNASGDEGWESPAINQDPDFVIVRAGAHTPPNDLRERMGEHASFCWNDGFMVCSRLPIKSWGAGALNVEQGLGIDPRQANLVRSGRDPGHAMWLLLDAHSRLGKDVVIWLVDLPSDLSLSRTRAMQEAAVALAAGPAQWWIDNGAGDWTPAPAGALSPDAFRTPDLIVGDFNTPHGSYSLRAITRGYTSAYQQAGLGYAATFPRAFPLWKLDQAYLAPWLQAVAHDTIDTGRGSHRMLLVDIERSR